MTALPARPDIGTSSLDVLRQQFAPDAKDYELSYFAAVANHLGLDPWMGHICLPKFGGVHKPMLTVAGRRWIAQRSGRLRGIVGPQWCAPRQVTEDGEKLPLEWQDLWDDDDDPPYAARCLVYVAGWDHPVNGTVKWSEFAQTTSQGALQAVWAQKKSFMLGKTAESLALRRAFPEVQAAVAYLSDDEETTMLHEVEAEAKAIAVAVPPPPSPPAAAGREERPAGGEPKPRARRRDDRVPDWVYDDLPEASNEWR